MRRAVKFCVKHLAWELGKHPNYVYGMTEVGYDGASLVEAKQWIEANGFVMVRGEPRKNRGNEKNT